MSIYAISDLHLSFGSQKPMSIFHGWENHTDRLAANWKRLIKEEDTVVLPGDFSWALKTEDSYLDFKFLEELPGKKLLLKGNHDLWWPTAKKLKDFWQKQGFSSFDIIFNSCKTVEGYAIAGTRGWFYDNTGSKKVLLREAGRLEASLEEAVKSGLPILTFLHYPPVYGEFICDEILEVLKRYNIKEVFYGHIHGLGFNRAVKEYDGIKFTLISADCIDFTPYFIA